MRLLTFQSPQGLKLGVKTDEGVLDVKAASDALGVQGVPVTPEALYESGLGGLPALRDLARRALAEAGGTWLLDESALEYGPCVPDPGKIICIGLNYRQHAAEAGLAVPATPVLFSKFNNAIAAPGEDVPLPSNALQFDYEVELAAVIGRKARYVSEEAALDYVMGYCNANDLSERDLQFLTGQWLLGKTLDKFMPVGPYLVTPDEVGDPQNLRTRCWVNGELRQDSNTADMIFTVAQIVSYISQYITLEAGDIISTGTPEGVIQGMENKIWLKAGDEVTVEVEKLGRLTNRLVEEGS